MHRDTPALMSRILARESYSALQYLSDAWPWSAAERQAAMDRLRAMIAAERKANKGIGDWLGKHRIPPGKGAFPEEFTEINYVAVDHLLPRLATYQRRGIEALQKDLAQLADEEPRLLAQHALDLKRRHLEELEQLATEYSGANAVSTIR